MGAAGNSRLTAKAVKVEAPSESSQSGAAGAPRGGGGDKREAKAHFREAAVVEQEEDNLLENREPDSSLCRCAAEVSGRLRHKARTQSKLRWLGASVDPPSLRRRTKGRTGQSSRRRKSRNGPTVCFSKSENDFLVRDRLKSLKLESDWNFEPKVLSYGPECIFFVRGGERHRR